MSLHKRVLIWNRGEIAIRIAKAATASGMESVGVYSKADAQSLHPRYSNAAVELAGDDAVGAYLDIDAAINVAQQQGCDCVHPGYGFLSENAEFAERCATAGLTFIGPPPSALRLFGDKVQARALAQSLRIPVVPGSPGPLESGIEAQRYVNEHLSYPVMLKAAAGGGGRGMRVVTHAEELVDAFERCSSEAMAAFGNGAVFAEQLVADPRHIEVQILADGQGTSVHLHERDCSIQLRNQKVIEIAPAPNLERQLRDKILADALTLINHVDYASAATVEFLVTPEQGKYYFIECNPRIQVEHTITEQITGIDLVEAQLRIAGGERLAALNLADQAAVGTPRGFAVQARVVAQGAGTIDAYKEPSGAGVRVDACGYQGYTPAPQFDPLLAKVICWSGMATSLEPAIEKTVAALNEFHIQGLPTNLDSLRNILNHQAVRQGDARTTLLHNNPSLLTTNNAPSPTLQLLTERATSAGSGVTTAVAEAFAQASHADVKPKADHRAVTCPMSGSVVSVPVAMGDQVAAGDPLLIISAMKMETVISAPCAGQVMAMQPLASGDVVVDGAILFALNPANDGAAGEETAYGDQTWAPTLAAVTELQALAHARLQPESTDPGVVRQRSRGKLTCRERVELLLDADSFREVGSIAGFASYAEDGGIDAFTPANSIGGWGKINERTVIVCADDFTSRGGHADGAIGAKSGYLDRLAIEMRAPSIRLLDGSSGGGSVAAMVPAQKKDGESQAKESSGAIKAGRPRVAGGGGSFLPGHLGSSMYTEQLSTVPVVNLLLGSVVGIGAAKAVLGHFSVMVRDIAQLFVAGPPVVSHAMGYEISKEDLGGWHIHCCNGSVDNLAETEQQATQMARQFLSYLPTSVYSSPPIKSADKNDPPERREEELFTIIPRKRTTTFDMRRAISLMADHNSFFEVGPLWGTDQITGFVRFNGYPLGVIASDSQHVNGGALTADGCSKLTRHLDLCDLFHIPVLNLIDNPGFAVGLEHEMAGTIRRGGEWMVAFAQVKVPIFTVVMRRSFGVAGNNYATPRSQPSMRVVWPAADVGGIPPEGGIEAAYKRQLAEAADPAALREELMARIESARGPVGPLNRFQMEEMIDPRDTRRYVCEWAELAYAVTTNNQLGPRAIQFRP
jgi:acetyl/propionyl-CoA carboxylase alpha subunit/acetyl-CoA carboxylase carboxyltransferase component